MPRGGCVSRCLLRRAGRRPRPVSSWGAPGTCPAAQAASAASGRRPAAPVRPICFIFLYEDKYRSPRKSCQEENSLYFQSLTAHHGWTARVSSSKAPQGHLRSALAQNGKSGPRGAAPGSLSPAWPTRTNVQLIPVLKPGLLAGFVFSPASRAVWSALTGPTGPMQERAKARASDAGVQYSVTDDVNHALVAHGPKRQSTSPPKMRRTPAASNPRDSAESSLCLLRIGKS